MPSPSREPSRSRNDRSTRPVAPRTAGFPPIWRPDARVLVLGSMPSVASLAERTYYGHPRNAFWPIVEAVFGIDRELPRDARFEAVRAAGIAIWDVVASARRPGSADAAIRDVRTNDIAALLLEMPACERILLNGGKAAELYARHAAADVERRVVAAGRPLEVLRMPSTSPAHAAMSLAEKTRRWRRALEIG